MKLNMSGLIIICFSFSGFLDESDNRGNGHYSVKINFRDKNDNLAV